MALRDVFKVSRKTFFNPGAWFDVQSFRNQNQAIWSILSGLFAKPVPAEKETFEQAYSNFQQNLARLKRDYRGMVLYRKLLQEKMISPPFVARTELGVTGDGSDMRINDQVLRIVELPKLQTNSKGWRAVVIKNND